MLLVHDQLYNGGNKKQRKRIILKLSQKSYSKIFSTWEQFSNRIIVFEWLTKICNNYLIQYENCGKKVKHVLLVHDWLYNRGNEKAKKENVIEDLSEILFKDILNLGSNFPAKLEHLSDLLKSVVDGSPNKWKPILKHPSLWNFSL